MKLLLVLFAVVAAAGGGYVVGDEGSVTMSAIAIGGAVVLALLIFAVIPDSTPQRISLRPSADAARKPRTPATRVLRPGDAARIRERERMLSAGGPVGLRLLDTGKNQIAVIKVIRNYLDVGLKEAKDISDAAKGGQSPLLTAEMAADLAKKFLDDLEKAGAAAEFEERAATQ